MFALNNSLGEILSYTKDGYTCQAMCNGYTSLFLMNKKTKFSEENVKKKSKKNSISLIQRLNLILLRKVTRRLIVTSSISITPEEN
jgi:hypothetical protein